MKKAFSIITVLLLLCGKAMTQHMITLDDIFQQIQKENPGLKMYDAEIRSQDEAAKGVRNWDPPEIGGGLWMTPYNPALWKKDPSGTPGMGQFMISAQQMFPNKRKQDAEAKYMEATSSVDAEKKKASLNELYAMAKKNYYEWVIIRKKLSVIDQNEKILNFMIQNAEIRYKNGLEKISAYYKAKAALGNLQNTRLVLENDIKQVQVILNTLMNRDKLTAFDIDTVYQLKDYSTAQLDSTTFMNTRSDIKAIEKDIQLAYLQQSAEKAKLKPTFGVTYNHMFGFGGQPMQYSLMGTVKIPMAKWSSKAVNANVESLKWKAAAFSQQKQMLVNEATGAAYNMENGITLKKRQMKLFDENIIPALKRNFQVMQLAYEQNTEQLFALYDAWETLNMTQLEYLEQLQQLLLMQTELERILEIQ
jgi:outer membrane protein TolC